MKTSTESQFLSGFPERSRDLEDLFLPHVVTAAQLRGNGDPRILFPEEAARVALAVPKRVMEFAAGRACARWALGELGIRDFVLLPAPDRQPLWPAGVVGSITHTTGFCAAAVARSGRVAGIGIDTEQVDRVDEELWAKICVEPELHWLKGLPEPRRGVAAALIFSAKEAFYKCQYPLTGEWLDFHDLHTEVDAFAADGGTFRVTSTRSLLGQPYLRMADRFRYRIHDGLVTAAVAFSALDR